ncbi:MAG: hypothetical protein ACLR78_02885 [Roseburia sp.]
MKATPLHWYYANSKGEITRKECKTIDGKSYLFNNEGEMRHWSQDLTL